MDRNYIRIVVLPHHDRKPSVAWLLADPYFEATDSGSRAKPFRGFPNHRADQNFGLVFRHDCAMAVLRLRRVTIAV